MLHLRPESPVTVFTQCSKCETVFKLSAEVLRAAGGQVRCGKCGEVFNALARLAEDPSAFAIETEIDLETRANSILESRAPLQAPRAAAEEPENLAPPGVEVARLQILEWSDGELSGEENADIADDPEEPSADTSMEFTLPPGELDRIFVESKARQRLPPLAPETEASLSDSDAEQIAEPAHPEAIELSRAANRSAAPGGFDVPDEIRREMLSVLEPREPPLLLLESPPSGRSLIVWLAAALAAGLLLAGQLVHQNREWLSSHAPLGGMLRALYSGLGAPVSQPANLSAYQLRQWGVTGDPAADGTLRVRASILNTAAQLEPYPLLRVTLANRFGGSIGTRDFEPAEYVGKPIARLLAPGERVDATMDILDPGKSAEGFEIDVCLRGADRRVSCANDAAAAATATR
ncbi:MAG TPA: zinc-ribbon and DUF3426 domain-containing protein [Steroidobacteraceae bacterium]|nr:zinc-ribbon and DUF3426 domain-containing protein [Steroidobacteraceae bacterium]